MQKGNRKNYCIVHTVTVTDTIFLKMLSAFCLLLAFEKEPTIERFFCYGKFSSTNYLEILYICAD